MKPARILIVLTALLMLLSAASAGASAERAGSSSLPTAEEIANAVPRDLVIDHRGLGYLRMPDGRLSPYGHSVAADSRPISPNAPGGIPGPPGGGGGGDTVTNAEWTNGGAVHDAAGRILFQLSDGWYVCSGTAVTDGTSGRSIVLTAAHCIYDDVAKEFALQAIFIPGQDDGGADGTDWNCSNDPNGCWILDHGVVDINWTTRTFPDNIEWDYGFYVVSDTGARSTNSDYTVTGNGSLDGIAGSLSVDFSAPVVGDKTHALGYSYSYDPEFMYCAESMGTEGSVNYWLSRCDLSGGSSGGPWVQPMDEGTGTGPIISVNSWGYTFQSGMAGPMLHDNSASVLFAAAKTSTLGGPGVVVDPASGGNTPPIAGFSSSCTDLTCSFTDTSFDNGGSIVSWSWDLGDGNTSTEQNPEHTYAADGTYNVTLTVTDNEGATDTYSEDVTVSDGNPEPPPPDPGDFTTTSINNGPTWTAVVSSSADFTGTFSYGTVGCDAELSGASYTCSLSGIPKRQGSVTFQVDGGPLLTITKP